MTTKQDGIQRLYQAIIFYDPTAAPPIEYKEPGTGAIEYARNFVKSGSRVDAMAVVQRLMDGELHNADDKRVRRCEWCRYYYRDITRNNSSVVCSKVCRDQRRSANQVKNYTPKPKKPTSRERFYYDHVEYPFWISEYEMLKQSWKYDVPKSHDKLEYIDGAKKRNGRRKKPEAVSYNGNEKGVRDIKVRFSNYGQREPGEVIAYKMPREEIEGYLLEKYGKKVLESERKRAKIAGYGVI